MSLDELRRRLAEIPDPLALLEGLFAYAPVGLQVLDAAGRSVLVNQRYRDIFGAVPPPELSVFNDDTPAGLAIRPLFLRAFAGKVVHVPPSWYHPRALPGVTEGRRVAVTCTLFPLFGRDGKLSHVGIIGEEVTRQMEEGELLRSIIDQSGEGITVCDEQGIVRIVNAEAVRQHGSLIYEGLPLGRWGEGLRIEQLDGTPLTYESSVWRRALRGEAVERAFVRVKRPDGTAVILSGSAMPLRRADGSIAGVVLVSRDDTQRVAAEEELARSARERERIMSILGHDLRNPLQSIAMSVGVLRKKGLPDPNSRAVTERILISTERMGRLIAQLLDFARAGEGRPLPLRPREVDLRPLVVQVVDELRVAHPEREIVLEAPPAAPATLDPDRFAQVVSNLVGNALDHGPAGKPVRVRLAERDAGWELSVSNAGYIPPERRARLFAPFNRTERSRGVGLGLFIVRQIVLAHGGTVDVTSTEADGTTFSVVFPR